MRSIGVSVLGLTYDRRVSVGVVEAMVKDRHQTVHLHVKMKVGYGWGSQ